jgi:hypothetical protein
MRNKIKMSLFHTIIIFLFSGFTINKNCPTGRLQTTDKMCSDYIEDWNYCCTLKDEMKNDNSKICYEFNKYKSIIPTSVVFRDINYTLDCNESIIKNAGPGLGYSNCGLSNPKNLTDCSFESTENNFCCYYTVGETTGCLWINGIAKNQYYYTTFSQGVAFKLTCEDTYITIKFLCYFIIILSLL